MGSSTIVSPGVYFDVTDLSLYIPTLSSTIVGMVGTFPKGPLDSPTFVSNVVQAEMYFGSTDPNHLATYALRQALRFGKQVWVVRVGGSGATTAQVTAQGSAAAASLLGQAGPYVIQADSAPTLLGTDQGVNVATVDSTNDMLLFSFQGGPQVSVTLPHGSAVTKVAIVAAIEAAVTGSGGSCVVAGTHQVQITQALHGSVSKIALLPVAHSAYTALGLVTGTYLGTDDNQVLRVTSYDATSGTPVPTHVDVTLSQGTPTASQVVTALNTAFSGGGPFPAVASLTPQGRLQLTHALPGQDFGLAVSVVPGGDPWVVGAVGLLGFVATDPVYGLGHTTPQDTITFQALSSGAWGDNLTVAVRSGSVYGSYMLLVSLNGKQVERFDNLVPTLDRADSTKGLRYVVDAINPAGASRYISVLDIEGDDGDPVFASYALSGGDDGLSQVDESDYVGTVDSQGVPSGLQCFANAETQDLNLLVVPGISSAAVIDEMLTLCEARGDCMAIIDPPLGLTVQGVVDWHNGAGPYVDHGAFDTYYGALYWSWTKIYDAANDVYVWVPPSGTMCSVYAFTDTNAELWFAPAGLNRGLLTQVLELEYSPSEGERDLLYGNGNAVNPLVNFSKLGITVWGQRTLQRLPTSLDRVNVARLILYLRKILATVYIGLVFEPDDATLWRRIVGVTDPYLSGIKTRRGLYDYQVLCDATTNTADLLDQGIARVVIYLKPTKAAEAISVGIVLLETSASFEEATL